MRGGPGEDHCRAFRPWAGHPGEGHPSNHLASNLQGAGLVAFDIITGSAGALVAVVHKLVARPVPVILMILAPLGLSVTWVSYVTSSHRLR